MNYNPQFDNQNEYAQPPIIKNAKYYRTVARERLKGFWWTAILATLIASLLGGVAVGSFSCNLNLGDFGASNGGDTTIEDGMYEEETNSVLTEEQNSVRHAFTQKNKRLTLK